MIPLSCVNCCHNPLQLGSVGTAFGFCTRHRLLLLQPHTTTCGQLLRKDLLAESAGREQTIHVKTYSPRRVAPLASPAKDAAEASLVEAANGQLPHDQVVEEVQSFGRLDSKIATMAALHRIPGSRAEIAMLSLSRGYFRNCTQAPRRGPWTSGLHLLFWTLDRLDVEPTIDATDLRGPIAHSLERTIALARWAIVALRLALVADVGRRAVAQRDPVGELAMLPFKAIEATRVPDADRLLAWLKRTKAQWRKPLSRERYGELRDRLHEGAD